MTEDPIVAEVRQARQRIFDECGRDLDRLIAYLKAADDQHRDRLVTVDEIREGKRRGVPRVKRSQD